MLRASGSVDTYTPYFHQELFADPAPAPTTTLRLEEPAAGQSEGLLCRVENAEALWLAGGDPWACLGQWPAPLHQALAQAHARGITLGGTSAGAMALGEVAFPAEEGTVYSVEAPADAFAFYLSLSVSPLFAPEPPPGPRPSTGSPSRTTW